MAKACDKCKGTKSIKAMGGMSQSCPDCKGKGIIIEEQDVADIKVTAEHIQPKKIKTKEKKGNLDE